MTQSHTINLPSASDRLYSLKVGLLFVGQKAEFQTPHFTDGGQKTEMIAKCLLIAQEK
jgi:hypothetical protein